MNTYTAKVTCPVCGKKFDFTMVTLLDTLKNPNAAMDILNGKCFEAVCPKCNEELFLTYSCLFHDGKNRALIGFADTEKDVEEMRLTLGGRYHRNELDDVLNGWLNTCTVRLTTSYPEFCEKVLELSTGVDDRAVEIAKSLLIDSIEKESEEKVKAVFFNYGADGAKVLTVMHENESVEEIPLSDDELNLFNEVYLFSTDKNEHLEIDRFWAKKILNK